MDSKHNIDYNTQLQEKVDDLRSFVSDNVFVIDMDQFATLGSDLKDVSDERAKKLLLSGLVKLNSILKFDTDSFLHYIHQVKITNVNANGYDLIIPEHRIIVEAKFNVFNEKMSASQRSGIIKDFNNLWYGKESEPGIDPKRWTRVMLLYNCLGIKKQVRDIEEEMEEFQGKRRIVFNDGSMPLRNNKINVLLI